ncbi:MAG: hypothetical protein HOV80_25310, partial [Polyangiaceae bacterium]|nr:hypothetical protein [Polyangiaceae bacterium]
MSSETESGEPRRATTGDEKPPKMKRKRSLAFRIFRVVAGIILLPIVLVALLIAYLHTDSGKERLRAIVEDRLAKKVNGTVQIGSLDFALFGDLTIGGVVIKDAKGEKAIALERLRVRPKWGELGGPGPIPLEAVELSGLDVQIVKDSEGGSNFKGLFEPIELKKGVSIDDVRISNVNVTIASPDGSKIAVTGVGLEGKILAKSATKTFRVDLPNIGANVAVEKPASGLTVGVRDLKTGLKVDVDAGKGTVELLPLSAEVALAVKPRGIDRTIPVSTGGLKLSLEEATASVDLEKLAVGLLTLSAIEVRAPMTEGKLAGVPAAEVVGLRVVGKEVNALLGKEVLLTDVDIDAHLAGTSQAPTLLAHVKAGDAKIDVDAKLDDPMGARPRFDLTTTVSNVDTSKLIGSGVAVPPATLESLRIEAKGSGKDLASLSADVKLDGKNARVRGVTVDELGVRASIADGKVDVKEVDVRALDQHVAIAGNMTVASKEVDVKLRLDGDVDSAMAKLRAAGIPINVKLPKNVLVLPKDDLEVGVKGRVDGEMTVTAKAKARRALGAGVAIDATAKIR